MTTQTSGDRATTPEFDWAVAESWLHGLPGGRGLNVAHECVDRHVDAGRGEHVALRHLRKDGRVEDVTYAELRRSTNRFANVLVGLGVERGERVFLLAGRVPELYTAALGTLKRGAVLCPLFAAFGPEPIRQRVERGDGVVLVTTAALYRRKIAPQRDQLGGLRHILLIDGADLADPDHGVHDLAALLEAASSEHEIGPTDPEDMALIHFTSGTTGMPKGAIHVHRAVVAHHATSKIALDLRSDDVFWCTADPGWVTGMSYGIIAPLTHGVTSIVDEAEFDARRWYSILQEQEVSVWYTAPTAIRMLARAGDELPDEHDLSHLRFIASVGEPLNAESVLWGQRVLHHSIHDNWWQSETGGIMIANTPGVEIRPGSMGRPVAGIEVALVELDEHNDPVVDVDAQPVLIEGPDREGMIAIRSGWPSMFRGYLHDQDRYDASFLGDWYLSGDLASRDADGWYWFVGRADDVIKTAGHLIGPFEVESVLMEHPDVVEAGVVGLPDDVAGNIVAAFVVLRTGVQDSDELRADLRGFARKRLGASVAPRSIAVVDDLPHTRSGKIMRRLIRARELGLPEGDLSTLETAPSGASGADGEDDS